MPNLLGTDTVTQIGIVVHDIEKTRLEWAKLLGVQPPPVIITGGYDQAQTQYKGGRSDATAKLCFFNMGQVAIELIQPDGTPSAWQDHLDAHGEGVQHIAVVTPSMKSALGELEGNGTPLVMKGEYTGGRYAYVDSAAKLGVMLELLEND